MNLNVGLNYPINKEKNLIKKELISKNFTKIISLLLTNRPIVLTNQNLPKNLVNKMNTAKKGYSLKNNNKKNNKTSHISDGKFFNVELSKLNRDTNTTKSPRNRNKYNKNKNKSSFYILNNRKYNDNKFNDIPIINTSFHKKKKIQINKQKSDYSISQTKNANSFSKSQNLNNSNFSFDNNKISGRKLSPIGGSKIKKNGINFTIKNSNKNNKFYLLKNRQNIAYDLKTKMSLYIQNQKKYSQREKMNRDNIYSDLIKNKINNINKNILVSFSYDKLKKVKKLKNNNTFTNTNITTNISDKDNMNISSRKNNITTNNSNLNSNSNNNHYFTTNFNSSTNITETNNDLYNENKYYKEKKFTKKKIKLPVHPNPKLKVGEIPERKKFLIRNNKSEIKIPFNKKNKTNKVYSGNSFNNIFNFKNKKTENINIHNTSREKKNNSSFIDSYINKNFINSSGPLHFRNKISISKNNLSISSRDNIINIGLNEGIEMNHFKIVSIIQENKRLLRQNDNDKKNK